ncbi:hypothetical protein, partial [Heyndrickxia coagulans]|uniref:hypothetical protein n=1 Tax=Heyndrickxia coagulans TaxID=1398 RepID=UPI002852A3D4
GGSFLCKPQISFITGMLLRRHHCAPIIPESPGVCKVKIFDDFPSAQPDSCGEIMKNLPIKK